MRMNRGLLALGLALLSASIALFYASHVLTAESYGSINSTLCYTIAEEIDDNATGPRVAEVLSSYARLPISIAVYVYAPDGRQTAQYGFYIPLPQTAVFPTPIRSGPITIYGPDSCQYTGRRASVLVRLGLWPPAVYSFAAAAALLFAGLALVAVSSPPPGRPGRRRGAEGGGGRRPSSPQRLLDPPTRAKAQRGGAAYSSTL